MWVFVFLLKNSGLIFVSKRELTYSSRSLYIVVRPSVCLSSVTFVRPNQRIEIFSNVFTPFGKEDIY